MIRPQNWSDRTYFLIGLILGLLTGGLSIPLIVSVSPALHFLIALACGLFFAGLAVLARESFLFFWSP